MGDITKNFSNYEFRPHGKPRSWVPGSEYQKLLIVNLAENLQVVRSEMPPDSWMNITNAVRELSDFQRLTLMGYKPSKTSDHNCGVAVPLEKYTDKYKKFGDTYNFAVGAADVQSVGFSIKELFNLSVKLTQGGKCDFGQIIYEYDPNRKSEWVHYGGSLDWLFKSPIINMINRTKFMKSTDGGRSYKVATSV